uniref:Uncharacterized protein n=1 Tax=Timema poppense TaxID=170557 RepID=A0A7R9D8R9_TIMPO|nr:unnamed protein product [Timema poppensis]
MSIPSSLIRSSRNSVVLALMFAVGASVHHCSSCSIADAALSDNDAASETSDAPPEESDHDTNSDMSADDSDYVYSSGDSDDNDVDVPPRQPEPQPRVSAHVLLGRRTKKMIKNNVPPFKWSLDPPPTSRVRSHNLVTKLPGIIGDARINKPQTPIDAWRLFIDKQMIQCILSLGAGGEFRPADDQQQNPPKRLRCHICPRNRDQKHGKNLEVGLKKEGLLYFVRELDGNDEEEYDNYLKDASMYARAAASPRLPSTGRHSVRLGQRLSVLKTLTRHSFLVVTISEGSEAGTNTVLVSRDGAESRARPSSGKMRLRDQL